MASPRNPASNASYALFILFVINLLNFFDRQLPGALAEPIRKEFHLSDTTLGLLGTIATLMYALVGLPLGRLADKWYRTRPAPPCGVCSRPRPVSRKTTHSCSHQGWGWAWGKQPVRPPASR
jgi:MFS family permease